MALPPPRAAAAPALSPEDERDALDAAHKAKVAALERALDASLKGKLAKPGEEVTLILPLGPEKGGLHSEEVIADVEARYLAGGWGKATVASMAVPDSDPPTPDPHGRFVLTLTP